MGSVQPESRNGQPFGETSVAERPQLSTLAPDGELVDSHRTNRAGPNTERATRVLVADGRTLVRAGLRALLERGRHITVVGEARTGEETVVLARRIRPQVAMVDARLPGLDSIAATSQMVSELGLAVMLLNVRDGDESIYPALRAGASGLLLQDGDPADLVRAVHALARGEMLLPPSVTRRLIAALSSRPDPPGWSSELVAELTAREREVVALVALGLGNHEIAERLVVSPATAKTHVSRAMLKLHLGDRAKLVAFAYGAGLVAPPARAEVLLQQ